MDPNRRAVLRLLLPVFALVAAGLFAVQVLLGPSVFGTVAGITLRPERLAYRVGDTVSFLFEYRRADPGVLSCYLPWGVHRRVESGWHPVVSNGCREVLVYLRAGMRFEFDWRALTATHYPLYGLASVEPGTYRVILPIAYACDDDFTRCAHQTLSTIFWIR
ncbi:MAG: hypothetical protein ACT4OI_00470 [Methanobacteriota archaeon]